MPLEIYCYLKILLMFCVILGALLMVGSFVK